MHADPKSAKNTDSLTVFFAFLESPCLKAACKTLMKLKPGFGQQQQKQRKQQQ